jgi:hypothetical protein
MQRNLLGTLLTLELIQGTRDSAGAAAAGHGDIELVCVVGHCGGLVVVMDGYGLSAAGYRKYIMYYLMESNLGRKGQVEQMGRCVAGGWEILLSEGGQVAFVISRRME